MRGEEREIERRAIYKDGKKRERASVHTSRLRDGTAPGGGIYLRNCPCQMGSDKNERQATDGRTIVGTVKGENAICRLFVVKATPAPFITCRIPCRVLFSQILIHHYPIAQSVFFSHVHVPLEPPSEFLPRRVSQPSRQSHPRRYRQVLHPVWRKLGRGHVSLSYRLWQLLEWYRVVELFTSPILRMQRLQFVRQIFQFEFRFFRPVEPIFWQIVLIPSNHIRTSQDSPASHIPGHIPAGTKVYLSDSAPRGRSATAYLTYTSRSSCTPPPYTARLYFPSHVGVHAFVSFSSCVCFPQHV